MWLLPLGIVGFIIALSRNANARSAKNPMNVDLTTKSVTQWEPFVRVAAKLAGVPAEFVIDESIHGPDSLSGTLHH